MKRVKKDLMQSGPERFDDIADGKPLHIHVTLGAKIVGFFLAVSIDYSLGDAVGAIIGIAFGTIPKGCHGWMVITKDLHVSGSPRSG
jgi:hypothetical protein